MHAAVAVSGGWLTCLASSERRFTRGAQASIANMIDKPAAGTTVLRRKPVDDHLATNSKSPFFARCSMRTGARFDLQAQPDPQVRHHARSIREVSAPSREGSFTVIGPRLIRHYHGVMGRDRPSRDKQATLTRGRR